MQWQFIDQRTLKEVQSGYMIELVDGTWFHPQEVRPITPKGMPATEQVKLLRHGLNYVESIGQERQTG